MCKQFELSIIAWWTEGILVAIFIFTSPTTHPATRESNPFVKLDTLGGSVAPSCHMATPTLILALTSFS